MQKRRTLILTLNLGGSYGGILQAYALQRYLRDHGIEADTTSLQQGRRLRNIVRDTYYGMRRVLHRIRPSISDMGPDLIPTTNAITQQFVTRYISTVDGETIARSNGDEYDAIVVGSDQVWRKQYVKVQNNLLDFAKDWDVTRISFAASFGVEGFDEYSAKLLAESIRLAKRFDGISVREDSAVEMIKTHWDGIQAEHHLDPTLLFDAEHYLELLQDGVGSTVAPDGNLSVYVLDPYGPKGLIADRVSKLLRLKGFTVLPPAAHSREQYFSNLSTYQLPSVFQWLRNFVESDFVVTDSFHGTVFSILFHKPFLAIGNSSRGLARFESLLHTFGLEDRLISDASDATEELLNRPIDWVEVDAIKLRERERAHEYLDRHLDFSAPTS